MQGGVGGAILGYMGGASFWRTLLTPAIWFHHWLQVTVWEINNHFIGFVWYSSGGHFHQWAERQDSGGDPTPRTCHPTLGHGCSLAGRGPWHLIRPGKRLALINETKPKPKLLSTYGSSPLKQPQQQSSTQLAEKPSQPVHILHLTHPNKYTLPSNHSNMWMNSNHRK